MRFTVNINCDGMEEDHRNLEVADILARLAIQVTNGEVDNGIGRTQYRTLHDINGNSVGHATYDRTGESGYPAETPTPARRRRR